MDREYRQRMFPAICDEPRGKDSHQLCRYQAAASIRGANFDNLRAHNPNAFPPSERYRGLGLDTVFALRRSGFGVESDAQCLLRKYAQQSVATGVWILDDVDDSELGQLMTKSTVNEEL